jgi:hypothetical protein
VAVSGRAGVAFAETEMADEAVPFWLNFRRMPSGLSLQAK